MRRSALILLVASLACGTTTSPQKPAELTALPRPLTAAETQVSSAGNAFAFSLVRRLATAQSGENVFVSPVSASMALGMLLNGASGNTATGMRTALALGDLPLADVNQGYHDLMQLLRGLDPTVELRLANGIWVDRALPMKQSFLDVAKQSFGADARNVDFADPATIASINDWVKQQTNGRIPSIMDDARGNEVMALVNATYFKGQWRTKFDPAKTVDAPFHGADGVDRTIRLMRAPKELVRYAETPDAQVAELGYGANAWSMVIVLPRATGNASTYAASLTPEKWTSLLQGVTPSSAIELRIPRFQLQYKRKLNDDLKALGMHDAFIPDTADFTAMSSLGRQLYVTFVTQKTYVDVNEEGTEAAAATGVGIGPTSLPPAMTVDRPFIFAIRERLTGTILFVGVINKLPA